MTQGNAGRDGFFEEKSYTQYSEASQRQEDLKE